ncbi:Competence protein ComM [compost metagenome]
MAPLPADELLTAPPGEPSAAIRERVAAARAMALARQGTLNQQLQGQALDAHAQAEPAALQLLQNAAAKLGWSARGVHRALRVARSIADLAQSTAVSPAHVAEAIQYRRALLGAAG